jgi:hypothetical protein
MTSSLLDQAGSRQRTNARSPNIRGRIISFILRRLAQTDLTAEVQLQAGRLLYGGNGHCVTGGSFTLSEPRRVHTDCLSSEMRWTQKYFDDHLERQSQYFRRFTPIAWNSCSIGQVERTDPSGASYLFSLKNHQNSMRPREWKWIWTSAAVTERTLRLDRSLPARHSSPDVEDLLSERLKCSKSLTKSRMSLGRDSGCVMRRLG